MRLQGDWREQDVVQCGAFNMTADRRWALQVALVGRLEGLLAGQGINGADVVVFDHVPSEPPRLHVRIDGFAAFPRPLAVGRRALHTFTVHVFDENTGAETSIGTKEIARLQAIADLGLMDWVPLSGATAIQHVSSYSAPDENPLTQHGVSKFTTYIGE